MTDPMPENPTYIERLQHSLLLFSQCVGESVDVCTWGLTIGETYVPFDPDEDEQDECGHEDTALCSQVWVRVENLTPKASPDTGFAERDYYFNPTLVLEVGILRCIEVPERGEAPTASDVMTAAFTSMNDMNDLLCAAMGCDEAWGKIEVGTWQPLGPLGGQYGGMWTFTVEPD